MTEDNGDLLDQDGNPVLDPKIREHMRKLEKENAEQKQALKSAQLQGIYAELGIPKEKGGLLFRDNYNGEATVEAVREAATKYDVLPNGGQTPEELERQAQLEALARINSSTDQGGGSRDAENILDTTLAKLRAATAKGGDAGKAEFDAIMASPEVQALRNQPISFM